MEPPTAVAPERERPVFFCEGGSASFCSACLGDPLPGGFDVSLSGLGAADADSQDAFSLDGGDGH